MGESLPLENYQRVGRFILLTLFIFFGHVASAQSDLQVSGTILDSSGQPLPGVNIVIKGTSNGTVSALDGKYSLNVPADAILVFSFVGFSSHSIDILTW